MYVLTREARKMLWSGRILIAQQLNELYSYVCREWEMENMLIVAEEYSE